jgi:hypothetical protein
VAQDLAMVHIQVVVLVVLVDLVVDLVDNDMDSVVEVEVVDTGD